MNEYLFIGGTADGRMVKCERLPMIRLPKTKVEWGDGFDVDEYKRRQWRFGEDVFFYALDSLSDMDAFNLLAQKYSENKSCQP